MAVIQDEIDLIDPETKTIHYKSGKVVPLSEEASFNLFAKPSQRQVREGVKESELKTHEEIGNLTGSKGVNTFLKNLSDNVFTRFGTDYITDPLAAGFGAISTREGQEDQNFFQRLGENYSSQRMGRRDARKIIDEDSPRAALAGKVGAVGIDLATPMGRIGRSPTAVGALFGAGSSDRSLFEDPGQVLKGAAGGAALGYGVGKVGGALERVASERRALRQFPEVEREAQKAYQQRLQNFRSTVKEKLGAAQKDLGKFGISKEAMDIDNFIAREIGVSALAGTKEGAEFEKFLKTLEGNLPETLQANDLQRLYEAIEVRAAAASEGSQPLYQSLKQHLVEKLPIGAAQNKVMGKIFPRVEKEASKVIEQAFETLPKNVIKELEIEFGNGAVQKMKDSLKSDLAQTFSQMTPDEFMNALNQGSGDWVTNILNNNPTYQGMSSLPSYKISQNYPGQPPEFAASIRNSFPSAIFEAETRMQQLPAQIQQKIENILRKNANEAFILTADTQRKVSSRLSNATGVQNPFTSAAPTNLPVGPYVAPQAPQVGRMAERFETTPLGVSRAGSDAFNVTALGKLFGVPKIGAAVAAGKGLKVGLEGMLRGLTSPGAMGNFARTSAQQGGLKFVVERISSSYPSYEKGVLKDPQDRKMAVSEIEIDSDLGIEDKAQLQAYINRGKNLELLIKE
jgi:hypothetical protein